MWKSTCRWSIRFTERPNGGIIEPRRAPTEGEVWEKFEDEYRPKQPSSSPVLRQLESAKYHLDVATFGFARLVRNIHSNTQFKLDRGWLCHAAPDDLSPYRASVNPWMDGMKNVRVKVDLKPRVGRPYVGVCVVVPFGN